MTGKEGEPLPESEVVFQDTTKGGALAITVWRDPGPTTPMMEEVGAMGIIRIYDVFNNELLHEERTLLSPGTIFGPGPGQEEVEHWESLIAIHLDEE